MLHSHILQLLWSRLRCDAVIQKRRGHTKAIRIQICANEGDSSLKNQILRPGLQTHIWEVWLGENGEIRGRLIEEWRVAQLPRLYDYYYKIEGRSHVYHIVSHDAISREQAIWFARQEYEGKIRRLSIDVGENHR
jgi:hypothetical protein